MSDTAIGDDTALKSADTRGAALVTTGFYYIAGGVNSTGQKTFAPGLTLSQAIAASGGF